MSIARVVPGFALIDERMDEAPEILREDAEKFLRWREAGRSLQWPRCKPGTMCGRYSTQSWWTKSSHAHARTPGAMARVSAGVFGD
jgi:hypothetical protein